MSFFVQCGQCGKSFEMAASRLGDPIACPTCGHNGQAANEVIEEEAIDVGEADVVESDDADDAVAAIIVQPHVVASDPKRAQPAVSITPVLALCAGAGAALLFVAIAGLGWWAFSREALPSDEEVVAEVGVLESTEMPWDVADANRHRRHNKQPIEMPSITSEPTGSSNASPSQTFPRESTVAEVRARIVETKESSKPSAPARDQATERDPAQVVEAIKSATVFIEVTTSKGVQSGSGFLFQRDSHWGTIVTNAHVIDPEEGKLEKITCVFFSGTSREFEVAAKVACKEENTDLAFLRAYDEKIPAPISPAKDVQVYETSTVLAAGFPFGDALKTNRRNPSITITKGTVSSLRFDDYDTVSMLQIDGGINPGNSGGPVVSEDGRLVGVAVAKVRGTSIGFAIPAQILQQTALGRVTRVSVEKTSHERGQHQFRIRFVDPNHLVKSGELIVFRDSDQTVEFPESDGSWRPAAERLLVSEPFRVESSGRDGESNALADLEIPFEGNLIFQVRINRRGGGEHWSQPAELPISLQLGVATKVPLDGSTVDSEVVDPRSSQPTIAILPAMMSDFAINPSTGDIACLDPSQDQVHLIRMDALKSADYSSSPKVKIAKHPVSVVYKRYQEHDYFVVACSEASELCLLTADSLESVGRIRVDGNHVSRVMASTNPEDPFVYYSDESDDKPRVGAVDLRRMIDCGKVLDDSSDCTISTDGRFAYRRSSSSSQGAESLRMISGFSALTPSFVPLFTDRHATGECVPGPFGQITALGTQIRSVSLDQPVATMDFTPLCFFRSRPVIVGLIASQLQSQRRLRLRAASLNTYLSATSTVEIPPAVVRMLTVPRRISRQQTERPHAQTGHVLVDARVFADDVNQRVVYASRDKIALIPLAGFELRDDEPLMNLESTSAEFPVGEDKQAELRATDPKVSIEVGDLPLGMKQIVSGLSWRPKGEDVGTTKIPITLKFDEIERIVDFRLEVSQPSVQTSIDVADFLVDPDLAFYVCWSGRAGDAGSLTQYAGKEGENGSTLSVIRLHQVSEPITIELSFFIKQVVLLGDLLAVLPVDEDQQIHLLDLQTLEQRKLILSAYPVQNMEIKGDELLLHGDKSVAVYSVKSLKRLREQEEGAASSRSRDPLPQVLVDGVLADGVLCGRNDSQPRLIVAPGTVATLPGSQANLMDGRFLRQRFPSHDSSAYRGGSHSSSAIVAGPIAIPEARLRVSLENRIHVVSDPKVGLSQTEQRLTLLVGRLDGSVVAGVPIVRESTTAGVRNRPAMHVAGGSAFVSCGSRIYRWNPSSLELDTTDEASTGTDPSPVELHFVPTQSGFLVSNPSTSLSHSVAGGSPPYNLFLMTRSRGVTMNDETGEVTLSRDGLLEAAAEVLTSVMKRGTTQDVALELKNRSLEWGEAFKRFTGHKLNGFPIAVPIHLKVSDRDSRVAELQYFVFLDIPLYDAVATLQSGQ